MWEASVLRPATYSSDTADALAALDAALSKSGSGMLGTSLSLADVSPARYQAVVLFLRPLTEVTGW